MFHLLPSDYSQIVKYLVEDLAKDRGILEVGCGNGQWARALDDYHKLQQTDEKTWDFVLAYVIRFLASAKVPSISSDKHSYSNH